MFVPLKKAKLFKEFFDIAYVIAVYPDKHTVDIITEDHERYYNVPFVYNYIYSNPTVKKDSTTEVKSAGEEVMVNTRLYYNEGEGLLYMPQGGEQVLIIYVKQSPYIMGFLIDINEDEDNTYNKRTIQPGEYRIQARDGAYIHIRRNRNIDIYASALCRAMFLHAENTLKMYLENAMWYFNVGHIFCETDYVEDGINKTNFEMWLRPDVNTNQDYFRMRVGEDASIVDCEVRRTPYSGPGPEGIQMWHMHIAKKGDTHLRITTDPDDDEQKSYVSADIGEDENVLTLKVVTDNDEKFSLHIDKDGNTTIVTKGYISATAQKTSKIHCNENMLLKADGMLVLRGNPIHENPPFGDPPGTPP